MKRVSKKLAIVVAIMILTLSIASTGFAAETFTNLRAYYKEIKIFKNGQQVQLDVKPFIVDGTTYVPVRAIANLVNKDVTWDQATYSIGINDKVDATAAALTTKMIQQEITITNLEAKVKSLEAQIVAQKDDDYDLDDLEDFLNDEYDEYRNIEFDITLGGDEDEIEVEIYVDFDDYDDEWDDLTNTQIKSYLQNIVNDIEDEFEDAEIEGFIENDDDELVSFYITSKGVLVVDYDGNSNDLDLDDLEDDLNWYFGAKYNLEFDIKLAEDDGDLDVEIWVDGDELDDLTGLKIKDYLELICEYIVEEFDDININGLLEDDYTEIEFDYEDDELYWDFVD